MTMPLLMKRILVKKKMEKLLTIINLTIKIIDNIYNLLRLGLHILILMKNLYYI